MLTPHELTVHLLEQGFLHGKAVVRGDLTITDASRRNSNYTIHCRRQSYLTKQSSDPGLTVALEREAAMYQLLRSRAFRSIWSYVPRIHRYDAERRLLILELIEGAQTIREHFKQVGRIGRAASSALGQALADIHDQRLADAVRSRFTVPSPWVCSLAHPELDILREASSANLRLIRMIQGMTSLCGSLEDLAQTWTTGSVIHNDLKWENILIRKSSNNQSWQVTIVDWELAGLGDPRWDVASMFGAFLALWLFSIAFQSDSDPSDLVRSARYPLSRFQPAIRSFWSRYARCRRFSAGERRDFLVGATRMTGARLIQLSLEATQHSNHVSGPSIAALHLGSNMVSRPEESTVVLLGITR